MNQHSSSEEHKHEAGKVGLVKTVLVTVSDTRTAETDQNGQYLTEELIKNGHSVVASYIVKDEKDEIEDLFNAFESADAEVIIFNGGTGISKRDRTYDVIVKKLEKTLFGFGEIFRVLSYEQVGSSAMLSRAVAGVCKGKLIISLPGSPEAVKLAWQKLIAPEIQHLVWELAR